MDITLQPGTLSGNIVAPPSKSMAHRLLICAAFADHPTELICPNGNEDIQATIDCLIALGAEICPTASGYRIQPTQGKVQQTELYCRESGSTLRFLLPIVGALGITATFHMEGRLPQRPLSPLWEEMERMGCRLCRPTENTIQCTGQLRDGRYCIDGSISSQFISGMLFALSLIPGECQLEITGNIESKPYIAMTRQALTFFRTEKHNFVSVEGDWSNAAFWLSANALGSQIHVDGLSENSLQGDKVVTEILENLREHSNISAADIPDLVPVLSVVAAAYSGAVFTNIRRLRTKESDRVAAILQMIHELGGKAEATENTLTIYGTGLRGGTVDSCGDHRVAMSAAIAATICQNPVTILGAECVKKSYPHFWDTYSLLGGRYEKQLR